MTKKLTLKWFLIGLLATAISAPNTVFVRLGVSDADPFLFNVLRFAMAGVITLPLLWRYRQAVLHKNFRLNMTAAALMTVAVVMYTLAIKYSQANYVSTITLITPIILVILSTRINSEKISARAVAGISLAAAGAMMIVILPIALHQGGPFIFYPLATVCALLNCIFLPLATITYRRANEHGAPLMPLLGLTAWVIVAVNGVCYAFSSSGVPASIDTEMLWTAIYSGVVVGLVARTLNIASYERVGASVMSVLAYLETLLSIVLAVIVLHEKLSVGMVLGGVLILIGVYVVEHHKSVHHKHHHVLRNH